MRRMTLLSLTECPLLAWSSTTTLVVHAATSHMNFVNTSFLARSRQMALERPKKLFFSRGKTENQGVSFASQSRIILYLAS